MRRFVAVAVVLAAVGVGVALTQRSKPSAGPGPSPTVSAIPTGASCLPVGRRIATPSWYPADLPLPAGSYTMELPPATGSTRRIIFVAQGSLRDFVTHALSAWPKQGWQLGRGEAEPGEAEDQFAKPSDGRYGAFRARSIFCDQTKTWLLIVLGERHVTASPSGTASLGQPAGTASP
jgi:hypothetical protein